VPFMSCPSLDPASCYLKSLPISCVRSVDVTCTDTQTGACVLYGVEIHVPAPKPRASNPPMRKWIYHPREVSRSLVTWGIAARGWRTACATAYQRYDRDWRARTAVRGIAERCGSSSAIRNFRKKRDRSNGVWPGPLTREAKVQVVERALATLRALAPHTSGLTLAELATVLGVPQGSMHRLLAVLEREQFVTRSPSNRRYFLGTAARQLSEINASRDAVLVTPHEAMTDAAAASGETVFLTELIGDRAVCVALVQSQHPLRLFVRIGQDLPLHASAAARVLLAYLPPAEAKHLLLGYPLTQFTKDTPNTVSQVLQHLADVRTRGYDVCSDELDPGVWAVSAPIRASTGRVVASVTLAGPAHRLAARGVQDTSTKTVVEAAQRVSEDLGWEVSAS
jgi:DNA-binding IclR family transcriptional regulator